LNHTIMDQTPTIEEIPYMVNVFPGDTVTVFHPFNPNRNGIFYYVADIDGKLYEVSSLKTKEKINERRDQRKGVRTKRR
jgi:hypothetical protein